MWILTLVDLTQLIGMHTFDQVMLDLMQYIREDFSNWQEFDKSPRHAVHVDGGVIELMPIANKKYYAYKYVNGHPKNPKSGKMTVVATGQLSLVENGYPLLYSEMTILTALRTAATAAVATELLSRKNSSTLAIIGNGAQSEFQLRACCLVRDIKTVRYFDIDPAAMAKFAKNIKYLELDVTLIPCKDVEDAMHGADIVTVCTAAKGHFDVVLDKWVKPGMHINGLGGDCPGKTELELPILYRTKTVVEYLPQTRVEGEIQRLSDAEVEKYVHGELWELITQQKSRRISEDEITLYQSVGFALEDFSALRLVYDLTQEYMAGQDLDMIPTQSDPKDLMSVLSENRIQVPVKIPAQKVQLSR